MIKTLLDRVNMLHIKYTRQNRAHFSCSLFPFLYLFLLLLETKDLILAFFSFFFFKCSVIKNIRFFCGFCCTLCTLLLFGCYRRHIDIKRCLPISIFQSNVYFYHVWVSICVRVHECVGAKETLISLFFQFHINIFFSRLVCYISGIFACVFLALFSFMFASLCRKSLCFSIYYTCIV